MRVECNRCGRMIDRAEAWDGIGGYKGGTLCPDCYAKIAEEMHDEGKDSFEEAFA